MASSSNQRPPMAPRSSAAWRRRRQPSNSCKPPRRPAIRPWSKSSGSSTRPTFATYCYRTWNIRVGTMSPSGVCPARTARWSARPVFAVRWMKSAILRATMSSGERTWDSCFNVDFSYMNGGNVRDNIRSRYRQWLTHKLASWIDQFDTSGCVGCGRCITWCPVGIDLTEEVAAIRGETE